MTPNPYRCETCTKIKCYHHPEYWRKTGLWSLADHKKQWEFAAEYGCASHSSASPKDDASERIQEVIRELERLQALPAKYCGLITFEECISLLRDGVPK